MTSVVRGGNKTIYSVIHISMSGIPQLASQHLHLYRMPYLLTDEYLIQSQLDHFYENGIECLPIFLPSELQKNQSADESIELYSITLDYIDPKTQFGGEIAHLTCFQSLDYNTIIAYKDSKQFHEYIRSYYGSIKLIHISVTTFEKYSTDISTLLLLTPKQIIGQVPLSLMTKDQVYLQYETPIHHICCEPYISDALGGHTEIMATYLSLILKKYPKFKMISNLLDTSLTFLEVIEKTLTPSSKIYPLIELPISPHSLDTDLNVLQDPYDRRDSSDSEYIQSFELVSLNEDEHLNTFYDVYKAIENVLMEHVDHTFDMFNRLGEVILLTGYMHQKSGHAICIYCLKIQDSIEIVLANSGQGLRYHQQKSFDEYMGNVRNVINAEQFKRLLCMYRIFNYHIYSNIETFYTIIMPFFNTQNNILTSNYQNANFLKQIEYIPPQIAGTCTYYSIYYTLMYYCHLKNISHDSFEQMNLIIINDSLDALMNGQMAILRETTKHKSPITTYILNYFPYTIMLDKFVNKYGNQETKRTFEIYCQYVSDMYFNDVTNTNSNLELHRAEMPTIGILSADLNDKTQVRTYNRFKLLETGPVQAQMTQFFEYISQIEDITSIYETIYGPFILDAMDKIIHYLHNNEKHTTINSLEFKDYCKQINQINSKMAKTDWIYKAMCYVLLIQLHCISDTKLIQPYTDNHQNSTLPYIFYSESVTQKILDQKSYQTIQKYGVILDIVNHMSTNRSADCEDILRDGSFYKYFIKHANANYVSASELMKDLEKDTLIAEFMRTITDIFEFSLHKTSQPSLLYKNTFDTSRFDVDISMLYYNILRQKCSDLANNLTRLQMQNWRICVFDFHVDDKTFIKAEKNDIYVASNYTSLRNIYHYAIKHNLLDVFIDALPKYGDNYLYYLIGYIYLLDLLGEIQDKIPTIVAKIMEMLTKSPNNLLYNVLLMILTDNLSVDVVSHVNSALSGAVTSSHNTLEKPQGMILLSAYITRILDNTEVLSQLFNLHSQQIIKIIGDSKKKYNVNLLYDSETKQFYDDHHHYISFGSSYSLMEQRLFIVSSEKTHEMMYEDGITMKIIESEPNLYKCHLEILGHEYQLISQTLIGIPFFDDFNDEKWLYISVKNNNIYLCEFINYYWLDGKHLYFICDIKNNTIKMVHNNQLYTVSKSHNPAHNQWIYGLPQSLLLEKDGHFYVVFMQPKTRTFNNRLWNNTEYTPNSLTFNEKENQWKWNDDTNVTKYRVFIAELAYNGDELVFPDNDSFAMYMYRSVSIGNWNTLYKLFNKYLLTTKLSTSADISDTHSRDSADPIDKIYNCYLNIYFRNKKELYSGNNPDVTYERIIHRDIYPELLKPNNHLGIYQRSPETFSSQWKDLYEDLFSLYTVKKQVVDSFITRSDIYEDEFIDDINHDLKLFYAQYEKCEQINMEHLQKVIDEIMKTSEKQIKSKSYLVEYFDHKLTLLYQQTTILCAKIFKYQTQKPFVLLPFTQQMIAFSSIYYHILETHTLCNTLIKLKTRLSADLSVSCSELRKIMSFINKNDIYTGQRPTECLLFEPMFGNLIRGDQFHVYSEILKPIQTNIMAMNDHLKLPIASSIPVPFEGKNIIRQMRPEMVKIDQPSPNSYKIHHVLMGKGKTSVLTPLIILHILTNPLYSHIYNIFIVLPSHLIQQTIDILIKYSQIFENTLLHNYKFTADNINELTRPGSNLRKIFVTNDVNFKLLHLHIIENHNEQILSIIRDNTIVIFDEFDSLYNPNISNFNKILNEDTIIGLIDANITNTIVDVVDTMLLNPSYGLVKSMQINGKNNQLLSDFIANRKDKNPKSYYSFSRFVTTITNIYTGKLELMKDYGLPTETSHTEQFIAVPYSHVNKPINGTKFADTVMTICMTILTMLQVDLRISDIKNLIKHESERYLVMEQLYKDLFEPYYSCVQFEDIVSQNLTNADYLKILAKMTRSDKIKYIKYIIIPEITYAKNYANCTFIDIMTRTSCYYKAGFTGTVNIELPKYYSNSNLSPELLEFTSVLKDNVEYGNIYAGILGTLEPHHENVMINTTNVDQLLTLASKYNSLLDAGAFLKNYDTGTVVQKLRQLLPNKSIIFIDSDDVVKILNPTTHLANIFLGVASSDDFIYYDHQHTVGIDIKQPPILLGLVTIDHFNTITDVSQSMFRLRNINYGHQVDFVISDNLRNKVTNRDSLLLFLYENDLHNLIGSAHKNLLIQNLSYINKQYSHENYQISCLTYFDQYHLGQDDKTIEIHYLKNLFKNILANESAKYLYDDYISMETVVDTTLAKEKSKEKKTQKQVQKELAYPHKSADPCKLEPYLKPYDKITYPFIAKMLFDQIYEKPTHKLSVFGTLLIDNNIYLSPYVKIVTYTVNGVKLLVGNYYIKDTRNNIYLIISPFEFNAILELSLKQLIVLPEHIKIKDAYGNTHNGSNEPIDPTEIAVHCILGKKLYLPDYLELIKAKNISSLHELINCVTNYGYGSPNYNSSLIEFASSAQPIAFNTLMDTFIKNLGEDKTYKLLIPEISPTILKNYRAEVESFLIKHKI
jgi:hypothetical protein